MSFLKKIFKRTLLKFSSFVLSDVTVRLNRLDFLLRLMIDVSHCQAQGFLRVHQLVSTLLLKKITDVLDGNNIGYWISYGTLIGAVRHKGFIPWDDDIDICVLRKDYNKALLILEREFPKSDYQILRSDCIRVMCRDLPCQVDVFPFDVLWSDADCAVAKEKILSVHKQVHSQIVYDWNQLSTRTRTIISHSDEEIEALVKEMTVHFSHGEQAYLILGVEASDRKYDIVNYEDVFPQKRLEFEGFSFFAPANPEKLLATYFGDYMVLPLDAEPHNDILSKITCASYLKMLSILQDSEFSNGFKR